MCPYSARDEASRCDPAPAEFESIAEEGMAVRVALEIDRMRIGYIDEIILGKGQAVSALRRIPHQGISDRDRCDRRSLPFKRVK